ncbi:Inosine/uridine-preferring nucleoside hydrolase domain [Trinorchestia longiramus]|nr:Inosine/uridine-preferring nucleoside hydrolase domain [Trinorchestia longiramus]
MSHEDIPHVIIDTDAGIDDSAAILMVVAAHKRALLKLVAITTTQGNTTLQNVNKNVLRLLETVNLLHEIPVYSGAQSPLVRPYFDSHVKFHGEDGFGDSNLPYPQLAEHLQQKPASIKIFEEIQAHPGKLHLLAIGPLTNLALAKMLDPEFLYKLASLHIMGGNTTGEGNESACGEFNFVRDPEAAQIVLSCDEVDAAAGAILCPIYITPWETCLHALHIPYEYRLQLSKLSTPEAELLNAGERRNLEKKFFKVWITCDQLAAAWMMDILVGKALKSNSGDSSVGALCADQMHAAVTVELQGLHTRGQMVLDRRSFKTFVKSAVPSHILTGVNEATYKRYLTMSFGGDF